MSHHRPIKGALARRVIDQANYVARRPHNLALPQQRFGRAGPFPGNLKVKTPSGGIPAMSGSTPGSATCTLYSVDQSTGAVTLGSDTLKVYNFTATAVGGSKTITAGLVQGVWECIVESC